jgi:RhtB (resistance to homoserine/threonine) family protein
MEFDFLQYLDQILSVSIVAVFMAISPGADFAMVTRNSIFYSRKAGLFSSLGIGVAIWIHVAYSVAGIAIIISKSIILFSIIKYIGAAYLIYIGWKTFNSPAAQYKNDDLSKSELSNLSAFKIGFMTNALNPKTTVFFLSIFTQVIKPDTPFSVQVIYGVIISLAHLIWFCIVSILLTHPVILGKFNNYIKSIERVVGGVLMGFGLKVALTSNE